MNSSFEEKNRQVVPIWRSYKNTILLDGLNSNKSERYEHNYINNELKERIKEWNENQTIPFASDLLSTSFVFNRPETAIDAAEYILRNRNKASNFSINLAETILGNNEDKKICEITPSHTTPNRDIHYYKIQKLKSRLVKDPYDTIARTDIAREYAVLGVLNKAKKSIEIASRLSPNNRFVLRSSARLYLHLDDPCNAQYLLNNSNLIEYDPWIIASEIAIADITHKTSNHIKEGRRILLSKNYSPSQLTELASAIGTLELQSGKHKQAKKLFKMSLVDPNDNAVAQALWASRHLKLIDYVDSYLLLPCTYEARAYSYHKTGKWKDAMSEAVKWLHDQPFSSRPAVTGSYIASTNLENHPMAEEIAKYGLASNPDDTLLLNNLTYALINQNKIEEAEKVFSRIDVNALDHSEEIVWNATYGLINFRKKNIDMGRALYKNAIEIADRYNYNKHKTLASIYLAREEILSKTDYSEQAIRFAREASQTTNDIEIQTVFDNVCRLIE